MLISIDQITSTLNNHLDNDALLHVIDESSKHIGHASHDPRVGLSHIAIQIVSASFEGLSRVERQRLVNSWLNEFFTLGLHSARYDLKTPKESSLSCSH